MPLDRASVVKKADAFVREGKLDQAIAEYRALVEENPSDSGASNTLGDLYARLGDTARAIEQYTRLGESEWLQGFSAKAAAFYKKALKVDPNCEGALARLGEIAASQSLVVDATRHWNRLLDRRRTRGDAEGEAEVRAWLADLKSANPTTRRATSVGMIPRVEPASAPEPAAAEPVPALPVEAPAAEPSGDAGEQLPAATPSEQAAEEIPLVVEQFGQLAAEPEEPASVADAQAGWAALSAAPAASDTDWFPADGAPVDVDRLPPVEPERTEPSLSATEAASDAAAPAAAQDDWEIVVDVSDEIVMAMPLVSSDAEESLAPVVDEPVPAAAGPFVAAAVDVPEIVDESTRDVTDDAAAGDAAAGDDASLIADLVVAAETPSLRFQAAVQLGRLFLQRGDLCRGIEWLEQACSVTAPVRDHGLQARYDLAAALERAGDHTRALEVLSDLEMDAGSYRDVSARISRLSRAVAT
jgi:tetratricopeptide (TPR) repeat protein